MRVLSMLLLCCMLCGCAIAALPDIPTVTASVPSENQWQPITFADTGDCFFQVESCGLEANGDYRVKLVCQNLSSGTQMFSCEDWCIDGWQVLPFWGEEVIPGEEKTFQAVIPSQTLAKIGIPEPQSLAFDLRIFSQTDLEQNYLVSTRCALYPSGVKPGHIQIPAVSWKEDAMALVDNNGCTMVLTHFRQKQDTYEVDCLLENKTRQSMMFRVHGLCLNGLESEQVWAMKVSAGAKCAATMVFDLPRTAGHVRELDMSVDIYNCDEWFGRIWAQEQFRLKPPWKKQ